MADTQRIAETAFSNASERAIEAYLAAPPQPGEARAASRAAVALGIVPHSAVLLQILSGAHVVTEERLFARAVKAGALPFGVDDFTALTLAERTYLAVLCSQYARVEGDMQGDQEGTP